MENGKCYIKGKGLSKSGKHDFIHPLILFPSPTFHFAARILVLLRLAELAECLGRSEDPAGDCCWIGVVMIRPA